MKTTSSLVASFWTTERASFTVEKLRQRALFCVVWLNIEHAYRFCYRLHNFSAVIARKVDGRAK